MSGPVPDVLLPPLLTPSGPAPASFAVLHNAASRCGRVFPSGRVCIGANFISLLGGVGAWPPTARAEVLPVVAFINAAWTEIAAQMELRT
jgi:hypothetical protein